MIRLFACLAVGILGVLSGTYCPSLQAFQLVVPQPYFFPQIGAVRQAVHITHHDEHMQPVILEVQAANFTITGEEVLQKTHDFVVYPNKLLLRPQETVVATISYLGNQQPEREQAYRLIARALDAADYAEKKRLNTSEPENPDQITARVKVFYEYWSRLYVRPVDVVAKITAMAIQPVRTQATDTLRLRVTVHNRGTAHALLHSVRVRFLLKTSASATPTSKVIRFSGAALGQHNILPGNRRYIDLPWPRSVQPDALIKASVEEISFRN